MRKISNHSFCILENLHCNFHNVENSNCTYHIVENIKRCFPHCGHYQRFSTKLSEFLTVAIRIVNNLDHLFHISSIQPTDLRVLPQILPQSAKFLLRACSQHSRNIPSLYMHSPASNINKSPYEVKCHIRSQCQGGQNAYSHTKAIISYDST